MDKIINEICNKEVNEIIIYEHYIFDGSGLKVEFRTKDKKYSIGFDDYKYIGERDKWRDRVDMLCYIAKEQEKKVSLICE